jgi:hypothetical protein
MAIIPEGWDGLAIWQTVCQFLQAAMDFPTGKLYAGYRDGGDLSNVRRACAGASEGA